MDSAMVDKIEENTLKPVTHCLRDLPQGLWEHAAFSFYNLPLFGSHNWKGLLWLTLLTGLLPLEAWQGYFPRLADFCGP